MALCLSGVYTPNGVYTKRSYANNKFLLGFPYRILIRQTPSTGHSVPLVGYLSFGEGTVMRHGVQRKRVK